MRLDQVVREERDCVLDDCDLEHHVNQSGRDTRIAGYIQQGVEWLERFSTQAAMRDEIVANESVRAHSTGQLREALGLPVERVPQRSPPLITIGPAPLRELPPKPGSTRRPPVS
jgi:hypothetical protein